MHIVNERDYDEPTAQREGTDESSTDRARDGDETMVELRYDMCIIENEERRCPSM